MSNNEFDDGFSGDDEPDEASGFWPLMVSVAFAGIGAAIAASDLIARVFDR